MAIGDKKAVVMAVVGKGLSSNDYTDEEKNKLSGHVADTTRHITAQERERWNAQPNIDCGYFSSNPFIAHIASEVSHPTMVVDGNAHPSVTGETLEEHQHNPWAHQNLSIDGNIT